MRSSTPTAAASCSNRIRRASKIAMVADRLCESRDASSRSSSASSPAAGMPGKEVTTATLIAIVRKNPDQVGSAVYPRRWVVERFFAWIGAIDGWQKTSRLLSTPARSFLYSASVMLLVRRIARAS